MVSFHCQLSDIFLNNFISKLYNNLIELQFHFANIYFYLILLLAVCKGMQTVKLCTNKILRFLTGGAG